MRQPFADYTSYWAFKVNQMIRLGFSFFALLIIFSSCNHTSPVGSDGIVTDPTTVLTDSVYYDTDINPLLISSCAYSGCHDSQTHAHNVDLSTYEKTMSTAEVKPNKPKDSELYQVMIKTDDEVMPPSGKLANDKINLVYNWILQGAKNNKNPNASCDTTLFAYAANVQPIMDKYCTSCHNGTTLSGGFSLTYYARVKEKADAGSLLGSIKHESGYPAMPPGSFISDCEIKIIEKWIAAGAPEN